LRRYGAKVNPIRRDPWSRFIGWPYPRAHRPPA
jgi:hypothetical protein